MWDIVGCRLPTWNATGCATQPVLFSSPLLSSPLLGTRTRSYFLHKLSNYYATQYDLVAVEDLNIKPTLESSGNSQNTASAAWGIFTGMLEYKCKREGTHFVEVDPAGTTKECASCGVATDKPLWVREHSCPACGFEMDRDARSHNYSVSRPKPSRNGKSE
ncbi:MAG: transposase, IS605 OrfB family, central region [uncultured archaeon A07HR60]|nr:MAG: transposase, IS605 OrfB family, central region [uncultured archaeon A07HR60]